MEAREYSYLENEAQTTYPGAYPDDYPSAKPAAEERALSQQYVRLMEENKRQAAKTRKSRKRELSFFLHVGSYSALFSLLYPILQALLPLALAFPISLFLPIGLILAAKYLYKRYVKK